MNKVAVITDSVACLTRELMAQYQIRILPLNLYFEGKIYKDWVDITPTEAYEMFLKDPGSFKTSVVFPGDCLEAFRSATQRAQDIVCVTVSSKLSTVYNVVREAKEKIKGDFPQLSIEVIDSRIATAAEGFVVIAAAQAAEEGKNLADVVEATEDRRDKVGMVVILDTIRHVYRSGRIPKIASQVGAMLNIRPLLTFSGGLLHFTGAVRTREHGVERMLTMTRDKVGSKPVHMAVMHAFAPEEAEKLRS